MLNTFHEHCIMISNYKNATHINIWLINVAWIHVFYKCHINLLVSLTVILTIQIEKIFNRSWTQWLLTFIKKLKKGALESLIRRHLGNTKLLMGVYTYKLEKIRSKIYIEILSKIDITECIYRSTYHFYWKKIPGEFNFFGELFYLIQ